jgi:hypothetical protein
LAQEFVAARIDDRGLQRVLGRAGRRTVRVRLREPLVGGRNRDALVAGRALGRERCRARIDERPEFDQPAQVLRVRRRTKPPFGDFMVDDEPLRRRPDARAGLRTHVEHPSRDQDGKRLAHDGAAHAMFL